MSFFSTDPQAHTDYSAEKDNAKKAFLDRLSRLGRSFWQYTEETGETSTKSFEGLL